MLPAATPQDPSIEQNIDNLDGPPDLQSYIYSDHFKHEYCDFDSITVAETPTLLYAIKLTTISVGGTALHRGPANFFIIATSPFIISCHQTKKQSIINAIKKTLRDEPQIPHSNSKFLLKHPITIFATTFSSILLEAGVNTIELHQFGQKGKLTCGMELVQSFLSP